MKRKFIITATVILIVGILICGGVLFCIGFDFSRLSTVEKPVYKEQTFSAADIQSISVAVKSDDVEIALSEDDDIHVVYYITNNIDYQAENRDGKLSVTRVRNASKRAWYAILPDVNFYRYQSGVRVELPAAFNGDMEVEVSSGDVNGADIALRNLTVRAKSGKISFENISARTTASFVAASGDIRVEKMRCESFISTVTAGRTKLSGIECKAAELKSSSGDLEIAYMDADEVLINTASGQVKANLAGAKEDYTVAAQSKSGDCNLPEYWGAGERKLTITAASGDISVDFAQ